MKECRYCGSQYADNLTACPNCGGNKIVTAQEKMEEAVLQQKEIENRERAIAEPKVRKKKMFGVVAAILVVIVAVIGIVFYNANKPLSNGMTKDESEAVLAEGIAFYNNGDYESAIECFVQLPSDSKQYSEAQSMLEKCEDEYSASVVEKANGYAANSEYEMAINLLNNAGELLPNSAAISTAYDTIFAEYKGIVCNNAYSEAETFAANGDYPSAITAIDNATKLIGHDDELAAKRGVYVDAYVSQTVSAAKAQYIEYDYEHINAAKKLVETVLDIVPDSSELLNELNFYNSKLPVDIMSVPLDPYFDDDLEAVGEIVDNKGMSYANAIHLKYYTKVEIDYQYSKLTGKFFQSQKYASSPIEHKLEIFGSQDGRNWDTDSPLWSGKVSGSSNVLTIDIDVSGWKYLVLQYDNLDMDSEYHCYMADMYLWK